MRSELSGSYSGHSGHFLRSFLRSAKILLQNGATLSNALRMLNRQIPSVGNTVQSSEMIRNSLGLNYKSAALDQLSYAGVSDTKAVFSELIKVAMTGSRVAPE